MSINQRILDAQVMMAQLNARLGAIDVPQSVLYNALGLNVFAGQQMFDAVSGGIVEVIDAGVQTVNAE